MYTIIQKVEYQLVYREMTTVSDRQAAHHITVHKRYTSFVLKFKNKLIVKMFFCKASIVPKKELVNYCGDWRLMPHCTSNLTTDNNKHQHVVITCISKQEHIIWSYMNYLSITLRCMCVMDKMQFSELETVNYRSAISA